MSKLSQVMGYAEMIRADLLAEVAKAPREMLARRPSPDAWSVAENLDHLRIVEERVLGLCTRSLTEEVARILPVEPPSAEAILESLDAYAIAEPVRKMPAPEIVLPRANPDADAVIAAMTSSRRALFSLMAERASGPKPGEYRDLSGVVYPHPVIGNLNIYQWILFLGQHETRHARQIAATVQALQSQTLRKAIFLDRDGVINVFPGADKFVLDWNEFVFMPGVAGQLKRLRAHGFALVLITNQSSVGRGLISLETLHGIHARMQAELGPSALDAIYFCPHHPDDGCACRKPSPEMILRASAEHGIDPKKSVMVGDSGRDINMGRAAGCMTILCRENLPEREKMKPENRPDFMFKTLAEAVDCILAREQENLL